MKILQSQAIFLKREFSSAGSEHLPYKQRVGGSNPSTPTNPKEIVTPLARVAFLFDVRQLQIYLQGCRTSNKSYSTLSITISFGFSVSPNGEKRAARNAVEQSEVNPATENI